jgi:hypothetical protein
MVATAPSEVCHVPPPTLLVSVLVTPVQMLVVPPIVAGEEVILTVAVVLQPDVRV